jgi:hypothetical protein
MYNSSLAKGTLDDGEKQPVLIEKAAANKHEFNHFGMDM